MSYSKIILIIILIAIIGLSFFYFGKANNNLDNLPNPPVNENPKNNERVTNFDECVRAGNPVMESFPRQCRHNGQNYTENIGNILEKSDLIRVTNPQPGQKISSPLKITGEARGYWFFEATFPIVLTNWDGLIIAEGYAEAKSEWMTENFVPFEATLTFTKPGVYDYGFLILQKSNASGLPEHDDALEFLIKF